MPYEVATYKQQFSWEEVKAHKGGGRVSQWTEMAAFLIQTIWLNLREWNQLFETKRNKVDKY